MAKKFTYRGKTIEELKQMSVREFAEFVPARQRRSLKRGFTDAQKLLLKKLKTKQNVETHCRDMAILPEMVGKIIKVHDGKSFVIVSITEEMLGHCLGEFVLTRRKVSHSAPGIGSTRSSASLSVR